MTTKRPKVGGAEQSAPRTRITFLEDPEEFARIAEAQRKWIREMADLLAGGEALPTRMQREVAAAILRDKADRIPDTPPRKPGQAPKIDAGNIAIHYACLVNGQGMKPSKAIAGLAEGNGVTIEAIRKVIKKHGAAAMHMIPRNPNLKKK